VLKGGKEDLEVFTTFHAGRMVDKERKSKNPFLTPIRRTSFAILAACFTKKKESLTQSAWPG